MRRGRFRLRSGGRATATVLPDAVGVVLQQLLVHAGDARENLLELRVVDLHLHPVGLVLRLASSSDLSPMHEDPQGRECVTPDRRVEA